MQNSTAHDLLLLIKSFWSQGNSIYIYDGESSVNCNAYMYMQVKLDPEVSTGQNKD